MRVAHLPSSFLPETVGGTEAYVDGLCRALGARGVEVAVAYHRVAGAEATLPYAVDRLAPLPAPARGHIYRRARGAPPPAFEAFLDAFRPDVVHFHALTLGAGPDHAACLRARGIPYVVTYHTPSFTCLRGTLLRDGRHLCDGEMLARRCSACLLEERGVPGSVARLLARSPVPWTALPDGPWTTRFAMPTLMADAASTTRAFLDGANVVVACARWARDVLGRNGVDLARVRVVRPALSGPRRVRRVRGTPGAAARALRVGFLGRLSRPKGVDVLVEATRRLRGRLALSVELAGALDEPDLARSIQEVEGVHHLGVLPPPEVSAWLAALDVLVVPSRGFETGPLAVLESWDAGTPVLGADRGGIAETFTDASQRAWLFAPDDPGALAAALERFHAREFDGFSVTLPTMDDVADAMTEVYASARAGA